MGDPGSALAITCIVYVVVLFGVSLLARGQIHDSEDYLVAGRRLPLMLAWPTLFATWFGAGTLLTATDEVRAEGLHKAALDPIGAGICLILAGLFFAAPLWKMGLLTLADFYERRFGKRAELTASIVMVPGYCGWIAAQFVALAHVMNLFFGLDVTAGILIIAAIGTGYTLIGGMWSVTLTDAAQMVLLIIGILVLAYSAISGLADGDLLAGWERFVRETPPEKLDFIPTDDLRAFVGWTGVLLAGALGNLPGQDLAQRIFAAKTARIAVAACLVAGILYLVVGVLPLVTGLAGSLLFPEADVATILPFLAQKLLSTPFAIIFILAVMSAVLSTVDSAILSPASVLSQNILLRIPQERYSAIQLNQIAVVAIGAASVVVAFIGESAFSLLESAYELGIVSLLVPLCMGLFTRRGGEPSALVSMVVGTALWLVHLILGWKVFLAPVLDDIIPLPMGLSCALLALLAYLAIPSAAIPSEESPG